MQMVRILYRHLLYSTLLTFTLGTIIGGTLEYYIGNLIDSYGLWGPLSIIALVLVALALYQGTLWLLRTLSSPPKILMGSSPRRSKVLILLLGGGSRRTAPKAYEFHRPKLERIWFVATDRTEEVADELERRWPATRCSRQSVENPFNPMEAAGAVERAVNHAKSMGFSADDVICDLTGGTTAMTIGAVQGCLKTGIRMEMIPAQYDDELKAAHPHETIELQFV
jgi:hypothetical protein